PVFMWLIGLATERTTRRRLAAQQRLDARVLDLVAGLGTLRALGRARGTVARVRELADAERRGTMSTLRVAFLSGAARELLAALVLAPEVLAPLRHVGTHFHASADGVAAVERCLEILREPVPVAGTADLGPVEEVEWDGVDVLPPGRTLPAPAGLHGRVRRG